MPRLTQDTANPLGHHKFFVRANDTDRNSRPHVLRFGIEQRRQVSCLLQPERFLATGSSTQ